MDMATEIALLEKAEEIVGKLPARMNAQERSEFTSRLTHSLHKLLMENADLTEERDSLKDQLESEKEAHATTTKECDDVKCKLVVDNVRLGARVGQLLENVCLATWMTFSDAPPSVIRVSVDGGTVLGASINTPRGVFAYDLDANLVEVQPRPWKGERRGSIECRIDNAGIIPQDELALVPFLGLMPSRVSPRTRPLLPKEDFGSIPPRSELLSPETLKEVVTALRRAGMEVVPADWARDVKLSPVRL